MTDRVCAHCATVFFLVLLKCKLVARAHRGNIQCFSLFEKEGTQ